MGAILRLDPVNGSDAARANLVPSAYANNGSGLVRVTVGSLGSPAIVTGAAVLIAGTTSNLYAARWIVTVIDSTHIDLQGSTYSSNPASKGTVVPVGGDSWSNALLGGNITASKIVAGDSLRVKKSQSPLNIGSATWDGSDIGPRKTITSSTNASPIVVTTTAHGLSNGDTIMMQAHLTNTNANGVWTVVNVTANTFELVGSAGNGVGSSGSVRKINGRKIVLSSARTTLVVPDTATWTNAAGGDTTWAQVAWSKFGYYSSRFTMDSAVQSSTKQAYFATGTLDLSSKQNLSFWIQIRAALASSGRIQIKLCSDTTGDTAVDTFDIPAIPGPAGVPGVNAQLWIPLVLPRNGGGNLGNAIQSISIWTGATAPPNSFIMVLSNINATATDDLDALALISKNSAEVGGTEPWWCIAAINGTDVYLESFPWYDFDSAAASDPPMRSGYTGSSGSATTYIRHGHKMAFVSGQQTISIWTVTGGTVSDRIDVSGGWDSATDTQTGMSWIENSTGWSNTMHLNVPFVDVSRMGFIRASTGFTSYAGRVCTFSNLAAAGCTISGANLTSVYGLTGSFDWLVQSASGLYFGGVSVNVKVEAITEISGNGNGIYFLGPGMGNVVNGIAKMRNNTANGINASSLSGGYDYIVQNSEIGTAVNLTTPPFILDVGRLLIRNCTYVGANTTSAAVGALTTICVRASCPATVQHEKELGVAGATRIHGYFYTMVNSANTRTGGSGQQWTITALGSQLDSASPARVPFGPIAFLANVPATVKLWVKKSHATNCTAKLVLPKNQLSGIAADVVATKANDTNWEQLSLTFTPTEQGSMMFELQFNENGASGDTCTFADWSQG